jgi:hypothetical protein
VYIAKFWEWVAQHLHTPVSSYIVLGSKQSFESLFVKFNSYIKWQGVQKNHSRVLAGYIYRGADKSLARPGRKQATVTEDFGIHISYL